MTGFFLHPRLAADTLEVGDWPLCRVRLMNDSRFPWLILVPMRADMREIIYLLTGDQTLCLPELTLASRALQTAFRPDKLNVAALGNMVPQLHIHVIARTTGDAAWPSPVWGQGTAQPYANTGEAVQRIKTLLGL